MEIFQPDTPWPADAVERMAVADLVPYAKNARTHSDHQISELAASMREWGFTIPVLVDESREIIAGHGRVLAASLLGYKTVPAMVARGWSDAQKKAYRIADNKLALNAGWDIELLAAELSGLVGLESLIGFSEADLLTLDGFGAQPGRMSDAEARRTLAERFGIPPFSILNAREGWWQERKRAWISLGIESEVGRGENLLRFSDTINEPDPAKREAKRMANGKTAARTFGQDLMRGEHVVGAAGKRIEQGTIVAGKGWAEGGPARRDAAFYTKKRAWEKANGRQISTSEFREKYWDGAA